MKKQKQQDFPPGWDLKRVQKVIAHYDRQTEDEEYAEIEAALQAKDTTLMAIPTELVPQIQALLARRAMPRNGTKSTTPKTRKTTTRTKATPAR